MEGKRADEAQEQHQIAQMTETERRAGFIAEFERLCAKWRVPDELRSLWVGGARFNDVTSEAAEARRAAGDEALGDLVDESKKTPWSPK